MERANVRASMIANGCIIEGTVENSILFRGVKVGSGAVIRNSIIMQDCEIGEDAHIENMILDKEVHIQDGKMLYEDHERPIVIDKRSVM
jgi:glucose-1-phosphate adenylyltransferase